MSLAIIIALHLGILPATATIPAPPKHPPYFYVREPWRKGNMLSYEISNGTTRISITRIVRPDVPSTKGQLRENDKGEVFETREEFFNDCQCYHPVWSQIYP